MPKTTKTSRKPSPASTKKSGFKRRFDITNKKVQFFVVIGIVAILGGGYFTFKSFAANEIKPQYLVFKTSAGFLKSDRCDNRNSRRVQEESKGGRIVIEMTSGGCAYQPGEVIHYGNKTYQACAVVKGSGKISFAYSTQNVPVNSPGSYVKICDLPNRILLGEGGRSGRNIGISYAYGNIRIYELSYGVLPDSTPVK